jgi:periodic tryptophan protein 2
VQGGRGSAIVTASLDGTVRAFDLTRYRNFKTLTPPSPAQFMSLAVDASGVCSRQLFAQDYCLEYR